MSWKLRVMLGLLSLLCPLVLWAAKAPLSPTDLAAGADTIVTGNVVGLTSQVSKSKVEKAWGVHRDREYTLTVAIQEVSKGAGVKVGGEVTVKAWEPVRRIPPLPGLQGHESIPEKGDKATFYLLQGKDGAYAPILPNGIQIHEPDLQDSGSAEK